MIATNHLVQRYKVQDHQCFTVLVPVINVNSSLPAIRFQQGGEHRSALSMAGAGRTGPQPASEGSGCGRPRRTAWVRTCARPQQLAELGERTADGEREMGAGERCAADGERRAADSELPQWRESRASASDEGELLVAHRSNLRLQAKLLRTTDLQSMAAMASSSRTAASRPLTPLSSRPAAPSGSGGRARGRLLTSPQFTTASGRRAQDLRPDSRRRARAAARWCRLQMSTTRELCNQCHRLQSFLPNAKSVISWCLVPSVEVVSW
jgi:hypothetical protein